MKQAYDLAIIGGGPAGLSAAITAARRGLDVILFEARTYPHDTLCGEFLSPECRAMLLDLGAWSGLQAFDPHPIETVRLTAPDGTTWESALPGTAWGLSRRNLDASLAGRAAQAGAEVCPGTAVVQVAGSLDEGFTLEARSRAGLKNVRARTVIGAQGKRSSLDRLLQRRFLRLPQPFVAFKSHFRGLHLPGQIELHAFPGGYCGVSPIEGAPGDPGSTGEGQSNVCFLAHLSVFQRAVRPGEKPLHSFLTWMLAQNPALRQRLENGQAVTQPWLSIAQVPFKGKSPLEGELLMAGDSAGLITPLAGDGISMALRSGMLASSSVFDYLQDHRSPETLRREYVRQWQQSFGPRLALSGLLQHILLRPALIAGGLRLMRAFPPLGRYFITHTRENEFNRTNHHLAGNRGS